MNQTMRAVRLFGPGDVRAADCPVPSITDREVLLKVSAAAICGTDLRMIANGYKNVDKAHPLTLGHEFSGVIARAGGRVKGYRQGMRVSVAPNIGCGVCGQCVSGNTHLCGEYRAFGINMDGAFAEYVRLPAEAVAQGNITVLDESVSMEEAAVIEPMSCVVNGQERCGIRPGDTVLVIGAGPIGVMHAQLAKLQGASRILIRDLSEARMGQCARLVPGCVAVTGDDLTGAVMELTSGRGADVCITACPSGEMQALSLELMAVNGRILFFGGLPAGMDGVALATNLIHYKQLGIFGSTRASVSQYRRVVGMLSAGTLSLSGLVTGRFSLDRFAQAVEAARGASGLKAVIIMNN